MAFPPICLARRNLTIEPVTNGIRTISPYSYKQTPYDFMGAMWRAQLDLRSLNARDRATFLRWLVSLDGSTGTFELLAPDYAGPFGVLSANPTIAIAALARAKTISVSLPTGSALVQDDQITIAGHLHIVTFAASVIADQQQVTIWPRLRTDIAVSDPVECLAPYGTWALAEPVNGYSLANKIDMSSVLPLIEAI